MCWIYYILILIDHVLILQCVNYNSVFTIIFEVVIFE